MDKLKIQIDRFIDCMMKPKVLLGLVIAIAAVVLFFFPSYEVLSALLIAIAGGFVAAAVLFSIMRRVDAAEKALDQKNKPKTRIARIIGYLMNPIFSLGFALLGLVIAIVSAALVALYPGYEGLSARLMAMAGGFLAVAVLLQTMKRAEAAGEAVVQTEKALGQTEKAINQTEKSIVQKTFSDAINHLGHESESVILGGIHSLLDLAKKNSDYRLRVFNILCAHIKITTTTEEYQKKHEKRPSTTIQTLLDLLFRGEEYNIFPVDPIKCKAYLNEAYLAGSDLRGYRLQHSNLIGAELRGASLWGAQLQEADLRDAHLQGVDLFVAQLQGADLRDAQLQGADLTRAHLQEADLRDAQLQGADLTGAHLQEADLRRAELQGAQLQQAEIEMQGAYMHQIELSHKTRMGGSDLRGASSYEGESLMKFQERIESQIDQETDLAGVVFDGVVSKGPNPDLAAFLKQSKAKTGSYTKEEADRWIKEYEKALDWKKRKD